MCVFVCVCVCVFVGVHNPSIAKRAYATSSSWLFTHASHTTTALMPERGGGREIRWDDSVQSAVCIVRKWECA